MTRGEQVREAMQQLAELEQSAKLIGFRMPDLDAESVDGYAAALAEYQRGNPCKSSSITS